MTRYPSSIIFAIVICAIAWSVSAEPLKVPVGRTVTVDVGLRIHEVQVEDRSKAVKIRRIDARTIAVTAVRAGEVKLSLRTPEGNAKVDLVVMKPKKEELSATTLETYLAEHDEEYARLSRTTPTFEMAVSKR